MDLVPAQDIEGIVGVPRGRHHVVRRVFTEQRIYILHSIECAAEQPDLRDCSYSTSLDNYGLIDAGVDGEFYEWPEDVPIAVSLDENGFLRPIEQGHLMTDAHRGCEHEDGGWCPSNGYDPPADVREDT